MCERKAAAILEAYSEHQVDELVALQDNRAATEAAALAAANQAKLDIIYSMHVLRYAGGRDLGSFGFGSAASSYYGKGNHLTGIDELDLYRESNYHGYAQIDVDPNTDDDHHENLVAALADAKVAFDDAMDACVEEFTNHTYDAKAASQAMRRDILTEMGTHLYDAYDALDTLGGESEYNLSSSNQARKDAFKTYTDSVLDPFLADVNAQSDKVEGWFNDKLAWIEQLYDSYYKEHLK
jgi:hypothetical protein